ncbi:hypothetical protein M407DRAFT_14993 [Tulasnella calospora MUT 4182]|uniref:Alpha/beta hydrolase fold-3 domain-containing protein n=1 Tax=Tulasnella calospora MUT 4182 TaxID=1051891 RepID=A0A0C3QIQ6_9AGAM|nr:hypothetical protein M407DRAFT_14993 [Tulasnella calospora MUT 4182]
MSHPTAHATKDEPSRWSLYLQAIFWRALMGLGMFQHKLAFPRPLKPRFTKYIDTTLAAMPGRIRLVFYTPKDYGAKGNEGKKYPCIVNFHSGGFTLGAATDDCRWATAVCEQADTIVCSVDYRRAPEHPFPTAVEDGTDAVMWIWDHADELGIDGDRVGVSGFSSGGNLAITVPLMLQDVLLRRRGAEPPQVSSDAPFGLPREHRAVKLIVAWYPTTDYTEPREERRKIIDHPEKQMPKFFPKLFDASYLHPANEVKLDSPYLSPAVASDELLQLLPDDILMYTCEWDELLDEGKRVKDRVEKLGKKIKYKMIEGVQHGWDKNPNPFKVDPIAQEVYAEACKEIRRVFHVGQS